MPSTVRWARIVLMAALAAGVTTAPPAQAANLFDFLFGGGHRRQEIREFPPAPRAKRAPATSSKAPPSGARISAPSYYTYKADPMVRVDFAALMPVASVAATVPIAYRSGPAGFGEALAALDGFDLFAEKDIAKALIAHYGARRTLIWVTDGAPNAKALATMRFMAQADRQGLDPSDYAVAAPSALSTNDNTMGGLMAFEMTLSARVLRYVRDVSVGRIDPNRISGYYDLPTRSVGLADALTALDAATDGSGYLASLAPRSDAYRALAAELSSLRASPDDTITIDPGLLLKPGQTSPQLSKVLKLIERGLDDAMRVTYGDVLALHAGGEVYVDELKPLIQAIQKRAGLKADGVIGPRTAALFVSAPKADRIEKVKVALEQLRWMPSDFGSPHVFVNQPAFTARFVENGATRLSMRVVVGAPSTQTSFFTDEIETVDYNPYWGVPQSIIVNEMLPRLRNDPGYLDRAGYEVTDARGKKVPSSSVNWGQYGSKIPYGVRQAPSEANALGELKILFPNKHAIYMHDTPSKSFFDRDMRALSHGCIRLKDPRGMAAAVLGTTVEHVEEKLARGHSTEAVPRKIPIYIAYFTAWPSGTGKIDYFNDVYGRDDKLRLAIAATEAVRTPSM